MNINHYIDESSKFLRSINKNNYINRKISILVIMMNIYEIIQEHKKIQEKYF